MSEQFSHKTVCIWWNKDFEQMSRNHPACAWVLSYFPEYADYSDLSLIRLGNQFVLEPNLARVLCHSGAQSTQFADHILHIDWSAYRPSYHCPRRHRWPVQVLSPMVHFPLFLPTCTHLTYSHSIIILYKTSYYFFYLSVALTMLMCGVPHPFSSPTMHGAQINPYALTLPILLPLSEYFQM